jgi:hypothetical protein
MGELVCAQVVLTSYQVFCVPQRSCAAKEAALPAFETGLRHWQEALPFLFFGLNSPPKVLVPVGAMNDDSRVMTHFFINCF